MQDTESTQIEHRNDRLARAWHAALHPAGVLVFVLLIVMLVIYVRLFRHALIDDAFITLDYARSLLESGTWGMYPGHPANTATSPLNVILLAGMGLIFGATPGALLWLAVCCFAIMAVTLDRISLHLFQTTLFGRIATLAFIFNPLLISTLGLESILFATLLVLAIYCYLTGRAGWLGLVVGLLSITRAEGLLFAVIFALFLPRSRARVRTLGAFLLVSAPWYLFSWIHLGSLMPDTIFIKAGMASYASSNYFNGLGLYLRLYPFETALSLAFLPLLAAIALKPVRRMPVLRLLIALGLAHFLGYSALHVPPFHWYYAPDIAIAILFGSISLGVMNKAPWAEARPPVAARSAAFAYLLIPFLGMSLWLARAGFKVDQMPIHTNWGTAAQYEQMGRWLEAHAAGKTVVLEGEIGTTSYYAPDCYLLDNFSDRRWLVKAVKAQLEQPGMGTALERLNFLFLRDGPDFPAPSFLMKGYGSRDEQGKPHLMEWETSTKFGPSGMVTLRAY